MKKLLLPILLMSSFAVQAADVDRDGLPGDWELAHGRNPAVADYGFGGHLATLNAGLAIGLDALCVKADNGLQCSGGSEPALQSQTESVVRSVDFDAFDAGLQMEVDCHLADATTIRCVDSRKLNRSPIGAPHLSAPLSLVNGYSGEVQISAGQTISALQVVYVAWNDGSAVCALVTGAVRCWAFRWGGWNYELEPADVGGFYASLLNAPIDPDGDGVSGAADQLPLDPAESTDVDHDGIGDNADIDDDNDGVADLIDNCPLSANPDQADQDGDGAGNVCDADSDNDGVPDVSDAFPLDPAESTDYDHDGIGDHADADNDNDGVADLVDNCPLSANPDQADQDGDGAGNVCDTDSDNDGVPDVSDAFPLDASEAVDSDNDHLGDNSDPLPTDRLKLGGNVGQRAGVHAGRAVAYAGDINGDGYGDFAVGAPDEDVVDPGGKVLVKRGGVIRMVSGKDNTVLRVFHGTRANQQWGSAIAFTANGNLLVGEPLATVASLDGKKLLQAGQVSLHSSADGSFIKTVAEGPVAGGSFGSAIAVADVNNDGVEDLLVGAPNTIVNSYNNGTPVKLKAAGRLMVFNGVTDQMQYQRFGTQAGEHFGAAIAVDAQRNVLVGSPDYDVLATVNGKPALLKGAGRVQVFPLHGYNNALQTVTGSNSRDRFGAALAVAHNGRTRFFVGSPGAVVDGKPGAGIVTFFFELSWGQLLEGGVEAGEAFASAFAVGDINGDGDADLVIGVPYADQVDLSGKDAGRVDVLSGAFL